MPPSLGLHLSIAGGYHQAVRRAQELGCQALQLFLHNPRQWRWREPQEREIALFRTARARSGLKIVAAHLAYLPNLAAAQPDLYDRSWQRLALELRLAKDLELDYFICHPGHAVDNAAFLRLSQGLSRLVTALPPPPLVLLENTAGQRRELGASLVELAAVAKASKVPVGLCLDTAHAFAAGYDLTQPEGRSRLWDEIAAGIGLESLRVIHLNDSLGPCHCQRDRHWHLGEGAIGLRGLQDFLQDLPASVAAVILETPKKRPEDDPRNLALARRLLEPANGAVWRPA